MVSNFLSRLTTSSYGLIRGILIPRTPIQESSASFKVKSRLKLRCRSCYFTRVDGRLHVECNENPRHKQREIFNVKTLW